MISLLERIVRRVDIPLSADIESGYAADPECLKKNIPKLCGTGVVAINIEDTDKKPGRLLSVEGQCRILDLIRNESERSGARLLINARSDVYIEKEPDTPEIRVEEMIRRGMAFIAAAADCFFPIAKKDRDEIRVLLSAVRMPVNISLLQGIADQKTLERIGVARVSLDLTSTKNGRKRHKAIGYQTSAI